MIDLHKGVESVITIDPAELEGQRHKKEPQNQLEFSYTQLAIENKALQQALAKRKEDIDMLTAELEAAKKTIAEHMAKLNWLRPIASMAIMHMRNNADGCDVEYTCDDILSQIRSLR